MILQSHHPEITEELKNLLKVNKDFRRYEISLGKDATTEKKRLTASAYYHKVLDFNTEQKGTLKEDIRKVVFRLGKAMPEFTLIEGATPVLMEEFAKVTEKISPRMNNQLLLAKILEVKNLFKVESDIFSPQNISRIELLLKDIK